MLRKLYVYDSSYRLNKNLPRSWETCYNNNARIRRTYGHVGSVNGQTGLDNIKNYLNSRQWNLNVLIIKIQDKTKDVSTEGLGIFRLNKFNETDFFYFVAVIGWKRRCVGLDNPGTKSLFTNAYRKFWLPPFIGTCDGVPKKHRCRFHKTSKK